MPLAPDFRRRLKEVLALPTAPFAEGRVHAYLHRFVRASPRLRARTDAFGNLLVSYGKGVPRLLFACHTDHPALRAVGPDRAEIVGGIRPRALKGARIRSLDPSGPRGRVRGIVPKSAPVRLAVALDRPARTGDPLLLDLPDARISNGKVRGRVIDDLCAVAACLALFDRLERSRFRGSAGALFTRAEEVGFAGALGFTKTTRLLKSTTIVNLEMSSERAAAPQGKGPILRVGDRVSTFSPDVTAELEEAARTLAGRDASFLWQRALMDGGACEATVYARAGFRTGALCLALRNYHNHAPRGGVAMEYVDAADAEGLVRWMEEYVRMFPRRKQRPAVEKRLDALWRTHRTRLRRTAAEGLGGPA